MKTLSKLNNLILSSSRINKTIKIIRIDLKKFWRENIEIHTKFYDNYLSK